VLTIIANGKPREVPDGSTIADLLASVGWKPQWVVVERNGEPVEIVRAVAGGASR
jgi:thiamine biosynthesis protein ThiS